jgi:predicted nuclease with TOPRIM domain
VHDLFIVGVPMLVILAGILLNRNDIKELRSEFRSEIKELRSEINDLRSESGSLRSDMMAQHAEVLVRLATIDADLRQFYHLNGRLEGRIDALEKRA